MCSYQSGAGIFELMSYRDPNIVRTLDVFTKLRDYLAHKQWSHKDIERGIIGCARNDEVPLRPGWATPAALWRFLGRLTEDIRCERRQKLISLTPADVSEAADRLFEGTADVSAAKTCVLSSRQKLEKANAELGGALTLEDVVPGTPGADSADAK
ncbi:MAG: hypothetical protein K9N51_05960 [Candidatus Pacebacteria bacterium]|nr:hypothetical protein [Candidatus Paceibacterota bacterium]